MAGTAAADRPEIWSVLVGVTSANVTRYNLRLYMFRVDAASGRVLGCRDDVLERFKRVSPPSPVSIEQEVIADARAALSGDAQHIYLFCDRWCLHPQWVAGQVSTSITKPPVVLRLTLADRTQSTVCTLDSAGSPWWPVSAEGKIWGSHIAPMPLSGGCTQLEMQRLCGGRHPWVRAGSIGLPEAGPSATRFSGSGIFGGYAVDGKSPLFQGYAVMGDTILISLSTCEFYCFHCSTSTWNRVGTTTSDLSQYVPLNGRAVYVEQECCVYFIKQSRVLAYKFSPEEERIAPPVALYNIDPASRLGNGYLVNFNQIICAVWIGMTLPCDCTTRHMLVTTFRVTSSHSNQGFVPNGIEVLHSTYRRVDMLSTEAQGAGSFDKFCFLQEFQEQEYVHATQPPMNDDEDDFLMAHPHDELLPCCRNAARAI